MPIKIIILTSGLNLSIASKSPVSATTLVIDFSFSRAVDIFSDRILKGACFPGAAEVVEAVLVPLMI